MEQQFMEMLSTILDCGYADVQFIAELCKDFEVYFVDLWEIAKDSRGDNSTPNCNDLIYSVYDNALNKAIDKVAYNKMDELRELANLSDVNCCASYMYFDGEVINNYDELLDAVRAKVDELGGE